LGELRAPRRKQHVATSTSFDENPAILLRPEYSGDDAGMEDLAADAMWPDYEKASQTHRRAMKERLDADLDVTRRCSEEI
jgi:hypothetical protein